MPPEPCRTANPEPAEESTAARSLVREITPATTGRSLPGTDPPRRDHDPDLDDETLRRCIEGDADAWEQFARRYQDPLFAFLSRSLGREHRAQVEDYAQEVMISAFAEFHNYNIGVHKPLTWLLSFARLQYIAMDIHRKRLRDAAMESRLSEVESLRVDSTPEADASRAELRRDLECALEQLPAEQREVFLLWANDVPMLVIANMTRCMLGTAKSRLRLAKERFRDRLGIHWPEADDG